MTSVANFLNAIETHLAQPAGSPHPAVAEACGLIGQIMVIPPESALHETNRILRTPYGRKFVENRLTQAVRHQPRLESELTYLTMRLLNPYPPRATSGPRRRPSALFFGFLLLAGGLLGVGATKLAEAVTGGLGC
jgi:hypothetical protein